ncbi:MAG: LysM peptidoglycan-binding domain-containing protein [Bacteroidota bacterium]
MRALVLLFVLASGAPVLAQEAAPARSVEAALADLRLATAVRLALVDDPRTRALDVTVTASGGVVAVDGIDDPGVQAAAAQIARGVSGVRALQGLGVANLSPEASGDAPEVHVVPVREAPRVHVVRRGDTLYGIARRYETTLDALVELNRLRSTDIRIGQRIRVR